MISRVGGLVRDQVLMHFVSTASMDAFIVAFRLPNMLRDLIGEGAANAAFIPVFAQSIEKDTQAEFRRLVSACFSAMLLLLLGLSFLGVLYAPQMVQCSQWLDSFTKASRVNDVDLSLMIDLTRWIFPYLFFIGMAVFTMGPLFSLKHYSTSSWSPVLLNITLIICCLAAVKIPWVHRHLPQPADAYALAIGVLSGGVAQLAVQYIAMGRHTGVWLPSFNLTHPGIRSVLWLLLPVLIGQATGEVNKFVDMIFAVSLGQGIPKIMYTANALVRLPQSIFGIAVAVAILPELSRAGARQDIAEIRSTLMLGLRQSFYLIMPAMLGILIIGEPIIRLLFQHGSFTAVDTTNTVAAMNYFAVGLLAFAGIKVTVSGFYAIKNTIFPVIIASISMGLNIVFIFFLVKPMGFRGLALATTLSYSINFIGLYIALCRRFGPLWDTDFLVGIGRIIAASTVMGGAVYGTYSALHHVFPHDTLLTRLLMVGGPIFMALLTYLAACTLCRVPEQAHFLSAFRKR